MEESARSDLVAHRDGIQAMLGADQSDAMSNDYDVLKELLTKIDSVLSLSIDVPVVASSVLDSLQRAYIYVHEITQARLVLGETSRKALDEFDAAFKRYLERKLNEEEEEQTSEELDKCEQLADEAVQEAKGGYSKLKELKLEEISLSELVHIESSARGILSKEEETVANDKEDMNSEVEDIDELLAELEEVSDRCDVEYKNAVVELRAEAFMNRCRSERLNEQILWLKNKESVLKATVAAAGSEEEKQHLTDHQTTVTDQIKTLERRLKIVLKTLVEEDHYQQEGDKLYDESVTEYKQRRDELNSLLEQAEMSLQVIEIINDCVELVMDSAREKNAAWEEIKLTYLLQLRDALMSVASYHMIRAESLSEDSTVRQQILDELAVTDEEIKALKPHLQLDTLQERIEKQLSTKKECVAVELNNGKNKRLIPQLGRKGKNATRSSVLKEQNTNHQCKYCKKSFRHLGYLNNHMLIHTGKKKHECSECHKKFLQLKTLQQHKLVHTGEKRYECTECHEKFARSYSLQQHMPKHTGEKKYECSECHKKFVRSSTLKNHMLMHTGEQRHQCSECPKKYLHSQSLQHHMMLHTGERPHECSECHQKFRRLRSLQQHMMKHTGERPHECSECHTRFIRLGNLKQHMMIHSGEKPHECCECHKKFSLSSALNRHMLVHTRVNLYECSECHKTYSQSGALKRHMLIHTGNKH